MHARSFAVLALTIVSMSTDMCFAQSYTSFGWHNILTQAGRNAAIRTAAEKYPNGAYGGECKMWVQNVVWTASGCNVWLPANSFTCEWAWMPSQWVETVACDEWNGVPFYPGQIVQAQVRTSTWPFTSPHTMIVLAADATSITVIESNYGAAFSQRVNRRTARWADFKRDILHYTLYQVK